MRQHCCMQRVRRIVTSNCLCEGLLAARFEVRCALCICGASSVTQQFRIKDNLGGPACTGVCQSNLPCSAEDLRECKQCPEYASRTMQVATREATSACAGHFHSISRQSFKRYPLQLTAVCSVSPYQGHAYGLRPTDRMRGALSNLGLVHRNCREAQQPCPPGAPPAEMFPWAACWA